MTVAVMAMTVVVTTATAPDGNDAGPADDPLIRAMKAFQDCCDKKLLAASFTPTSKVDERAPKCFLAAIKLTRDPAQGFLACSTAHLAINNREVASEWLGELMRGEDLYQTLSHFERYNKERIIKLFAHRPEEKHRLLDRLLDAAKLWDRVLNRITILCAAIATAPLEPPPPAFLFELSEAIRKVRRFLRKMQRLVTLAELIAILKYPSEGEKPAGQLIQLIDRLPEDFSTLAAYLAGVFEYIGTQGIGATVMNLEQAELMALLDSFDLIGNYIFLSVLALEEIPQGQRSPNYNQLIWRILRLGKDLMKHPFWSASTVSFYPRRQESWEGYNFNRLDLLCNTFKVFKGAHRHSQAERALVWIFRRLTEDSYWYTLGHPDGQALRQLAIQAVERYSENPLRALGSRGGGGEDTLADPVQAVCRVYLVKPRAGPVNWSLLRAIQAQAAVREATRQEVDLAVAQKLEKWRCEWRQLFVRAAVERWSGEGGDDDDDDDEWEEEDGPSRAPFVTMPGIEGFLETIEALEKNIDQEWTPLLGVVGAVELVGDEEDRMEGFMLLTVLAGWMRTLEKICWPIDGVLAILDQYEGEDDSEALLDFILIKRMSIKIWGFFRRFDQQHQRMLAQLSRSRPNQSAKTSLFTG